MALDVEGKVVADLEMVEHMSQEAPYPVPLAELVSRVGYKQGWTFTLAHTDRGQGSVGLTLRILIRTPDSYHPEDIRGVMHYFIVPAAAYDEQSWRRWLFDRVLDVETHEACEFFQIDGTRPYAPNHGPGRDPYVIFEYATDEHRRTSFRGELNPQ
jgi:hypothetical protein